MPSTSFLLAAVFVTLLTIIGILNCLYMTQASLPAVSRSQHTPHAIGGRWQLVQASLGLEPLSATIAISTYTPMPPSSSRIDFRRRKRAVPTPLYFAHDARRESSLSLKELVTSLRKIALEETRVEARSETKRGRSRLGRNTIHKGQSTISH